MKSLHKAGPSKPLEAWSPPDLESEARVLPEVIHKEQVMGIFQKKKDALAGQKKKIQKSEGAGRHVSLWQPGLLSDRAENSSRSDEWSFIAIKDTPFDRSWKVKSPNMLPEGAAPRENVSMENEGAKILENARRQAEEIILAAQSEADDVLLQAQSEIEEQKKEGYKQGHIEARLEIESSMNAVKKMIEEVEAWETDLLSQSEGILVGMIKDISRKMFGEGAELDANALQANLNRIMENAHGLGALKIFIHPRDARMLDSFWGEQQMLVLGEQVKIVPSNNIKPGGCLIKGNMGTVDGRVETQLNAILETFDETGKSAG